MDKHFKPTGAKGLGRYNPKPGKYMGTFHPDSGKAEGVHHEGHKHTHESAGHASEGKSFHFQLKPGDDGMR